MYSSNLPQPAGEGWNTSSNCDCRFPLVGKEGLKTNCDDLDDVPVVGEDPGGFFNFGQVMPAVK